MVPIRSRRGRQTAFVALLILLLFCGPLLGSASASAEASSPSSDQNDTVKLDPIADKVEEAQLGTESTHQNEVPQTASPEPSSDSLVHITPHPEEEETAKTDANAPSGTPVSVEEPASLDKPSSETADVSITSEARTYLTAPIR